jgi:AraC-like DNA-binding protein
MQRLRLECPDAHDPGSTTLVLGEHAALTSAKTAGVPLFRRCPPMHSILIGRSLIEVHGRTETPRVIAIPASTPHTLLALQDPHACVAYLDPRRFRFEHVQRLAQRWRGFVPGRDDLREAFGDTRKVPEHPVDRRVLRTLEAIETEGLSIPNAAARVGLSPSRLTHLVTEQLGAPPRTWVAWFKLRRAIGQSLFTGANLTQSAHEAGFADSAHLTRTCKKLMGVRPAMMLPQTVYVDAA